MVGVPRSTGCQSCIKRRVKCDEARPECLRCQKAGKTCPGYAKRFVFKQSSLALSRPSKATYDQNSSTSSSASPAESQMIAFSDSSESDGYLDSYQAPLEVYLPSPILQQFQLMANLINAFDPVTGGGRQGLFMRNWMTQVYNRTGNGVSLDVSMRSLACLFHGVSTSDTRLINVGRSLYVDALRALHDEIPNPRASKADIQSSTMLLTFYELMANKKEDSWIKHSGGASQIMRIRGPAAYRSGFEYSMYLVCRTHILIESIMSEQPCFLEEPGWEELMRLPGLPEPVARQERLISNHTKLPRLLRDAQRANRGEHDVTDVMQRASALRASTKADFEVWYNGLVETDSYPTEKPSGDPLIPMALDFPTVIVPGMLCSTYTILIIINHLLVDAGHPSSAELILENQAAALEICKCTFKAQKRLLGAIYLIFWLKVAAEACAPEYHGWIMNKLEVFMAMGERKSGEPLLLG